MNGIKGTEINKDIITELSLRKKILKERATALASKKIEIEDEDHIEVLEFKLAQEHYAIETRFIREVYPLKEITPLPCTPPFVTGLINVRGQIISVIDIRKFFDLPLKGLTDLCRIIIIRNGWMEFGIFADDITGMRSIPAKDIQSSLSLLSGIRAEYLKGITKDQIVILDAGKILTDKKIIIHEEV